jgi:hypothetical protein
MRFIYKVLLSLSFIILFTGCTDEDAEVSAFSVGPVYDQNGTMIIDPIYSDIHTDLNMVFTSDGWIRDYDTYYSGDSSIRSNNISDDGSTCVKTYINGSGTLRFYWKVSSESGYDYLKFYEDNNLEYSISGSVNWERKTFYQGSTGDHEYKWCYTKDANTNSGSDSGWIDQVTFTP